MADVGEKPDGEQRSAAAGRDEGWPPARSTRTARTVHPLVTHRQAAAPKGPPWSLSISEDMLRVEVVGRDLETARRRTGDSSSSIKATV
jgi:hypothetical protein